MSTSSSGDAAVKRFLFELPVFGEDAIYGPELVTEGHDVEIRLGYVRDGQQFLGRLVFVWARCIRYTAEPVVSLFQIEGVYDKLVEVENSPWVAALVEGKRASHLNLSHFMIYVSDAGCYEFAAESWSYQESPVDH